MNIWIIYNILSNNNFITSILLILLLNTIPHVTNGLSDLVNEIISKLFYHILN